MDKNNLFLIRPMVYINESSIRKFALNNKLPIIKNPCPADGKTKRQDMKELIKDLDRKIPCFKKNIFGCLNNPSQLFIWDKERIKHE